MHFALRAADITGARHTCNAARRNKSLYISLVLSRCDDTLVTDSVAIVRIPVVVPAVTRRILID